MARERMIKQPTTKVRKRKKVADAKGTDAPVVERRQRRRRRSGPKAKRDGFVRLRQSQIDALMHRQYALGMIDGRLDTARDLAIKQLDAGGE